jgi:hypothetical protein
MRKHIGMNNPIAGPMISRRRTLRVPRGLAMLRALRLRLAAGKQPRFHQQEFRFSE